MLFIWFITGEDSPLVRRKTMWVCEKKGIIHGI